jgi:glycosyltransferase involved in cell wall biosynthesis
MRILLYNWVQYDDIESRGGGVRIYEKNLVEYLANSSDHEVYTMASGLEHDFLDPRIRIEPTQNMHGPRVKSFTVVNSTVIAPGHHAFGSAHLFDEGEMLEVWHDFLERHGPFDVIQFDSLEGIPFTFLRVHEKFPNTRVLLYAHNYYIVCPQVNLWKEERVHCSDYHKGRDCVNCIPNLPNPHEVLRAHQVSRVLRRSRITPNTKGYALAYRIYGQLRNGRYSRISRPLLAPLLGPALMRRRKRLQQDRQRRGAVGQIATNPVAPVEPVSLSLSTRFVSRRQRGVNMINNEVDLLLATSHRVLDVLKAHGIDEGKMAVAYAGTRAAEKFKDAELRKELQVQGELTVCYLGYMRRDKGFYFLLDTLESCPPDLKSKIRLVLGAKTADPETMNRLIALSDQMADIVHFDGYTHEQLETILDGVDVGMIPVQWEDNLPQVATEMVAHGVPLITSHRGGAKELGGDNRAFVFKSSDKEALIEIWRKLVEGELQPGDYWEKAMSLTTMEDHLNRLMELWANPEAPLQDVRPTVDPAEHKTHIHELDSAAAAEEQSHHLDRHAPPYGAPAYDDDATDDDFASERAAGEDLDVPEREYAEVADSNPAVQAANSIPEAAKEAASTHATRPAQPLDNEEPGLT